jgi:hypothetical protein
MPNIKFKQPHTLLPFSTAKPRTFNALLCDGVTSTDFIVEDSTKTRLAADQLPRKSAAPPTPPLPELPKAKPWGVYAVVLLMGVMLGWLVGR